MADDDIRKRAEQILSEVPPLGQQINSDGPTAALFTKLTGGVKHETLVKNWAKGGMLTCCNEFVGWYAARLGSQKYLGRFDLETFLPSIGKAQSWVKSNEDARPEYGDICRHTAFHVGIALDFDGDIWTHVDAGQGGPNAGHDIIKRTRGSALYDYKKLQGWINIERYFDPTAQTVPVPSWLLGWWNITWRGQTYYYYFDGNYQVKWTRIVPINTLQPPSVADDTGNVTVTILNAVTIRWGATGSVEEFRKPQTKDDPMGGTWNYTEQLTAAKM